ncbi:hypothetical protein DEJ31_05700 [Curtobacterium sp. MCPF17_031]|nr:hypothetical protein DEJ31_05700 [Curtobacterium sp. MCPF17_031]
MVTSRAREGRKGARSRPARAGAHPLSGPGPGGRRRWSAGAVAAAESLAPGSAPPDGFRGEGGARYTSVSVPRESRGLVRDTGRFRGRPYDARGDRCLEWSQHSGLGRRNGRGVRGERGDAASCTVARAGHGDVRGCLVLSRRSLVTTALLAVAVTGLTGCAAGAGPTGTAPGAQHTVDDAGTGGATAGVDVAARALPTGGIPDYQLGGSYTPPAGVTIVERDSTAKPAAGTYGICYVNGFQTQPEDRASWLSEHPGAVLRTAAGKPVIDPGWPDELILDTRTASARATITSVSTRSIARCADRGFDAVEFDNLDSWTRSGGRLTRSGNLALATSLVRVAHQHGLAAAQKNTPQLGVSGRERTGFDFAVAEECVQYDECAAYTDVYGARVIDVEYADTLQGKWSAVCAMTDRPRMTILRDRELVAAGEDGYVFRHC